MKRDTGSSMLTKWRVWDAVLENYWVEVDVIYKSKIKLEDLEEDGLSLSCSVAFPAPVTPSSITSRPAVISQAWEVSEEPPQTPRTQCLLSSKWQKPARGGWPCLHNTSDAQNSSRFIWEEWKLTAGFAASTSKGLSFQMSAESSSNRRKGLWRIHQMKWQKRWEKFLYNCSFWNTNLTNTC